MISAPFAAIILQVGAIGVPASSASVRSNGQAKVIVALGDSITAGYGLDDPTTESWPAQAQSLSNGRYVLVNAGMSGDELAAKAGWSPYGPPMQDRLRAVLATHPWGIVVLGGANDVGLVDVRVDEAAIQTMAQEIDAAHVRFAVVTVTPLGPEAIMPGYETFARDLNGWILATYPGHTIDYWRYLTGGSGAAMLDALDSGDGVHPNEIAAHWLAVHVLDLLPRLSSSL